MQNFKHQSRSYIQLATCFKEQLHSIQVHGSRHRDLAPCSSGLDKCDVLWREVVSHSPNCEPGRPWHRTYDGRWPLDNHVSVRMTAGGPWTTMSPYVWRPVAPGRPCPRTYDGRWPLDDHVPVRTTADGPWTTMSPYVWRPVVPGRPCLRTYDGRWHLDDHVSVRMTASGPNIPLEDGRTRDLG